MENYSEQENRLKDIIPGNTLKTRTVQHKEPRTIKPVPPRYRNEIGKYITLRDEEKCINCGKCVEVCPQGVHVHKQGYKYFSEPKNHLCFGIKCRDKGCYCVDACPAGALKVELNPMLEVLGDCRWTAEMILATWKMAETGDVPSPDYGLEYETGSSGGGFDRIRFRFPEKPVKEYRPDDIEDRKSVV